MEWREAGAWSAFGLQLQNPRLRRGDHDDFGLFPGPSEDLSEMLLGRMPPASEEYSLVGGDNVDLPQLPNTFQRPSPGECEGTFARVEANAMGPAVCQLLIDGHIRGHVSIDIVTVDAVHAPAFETARRKKFHQFARKQDIDVRRQNEFALRSPDADVFGNHLVQRKSLMMT